MTDNLRGNIWLCFHSNSSSSWILTKQKLKAQLSLRVEVGARIMGNDSVSVGPPLLFFFFLLFAAQTQRTGKSLFLFANLSLWFLVDASSLLPDFGYTG